MTDIQQKQPAAAADWNPDKGKVPGTLNVLTILTFIGCGIGLIFSLYGFTHAREAYETMLQNQGNLDNAPAFVKKMMTPEMLEVQRKLMENKVPVLILSLVGYLLCLYGAIQMRALKRVGFSIYVIGEIVPTVALFIFIGTGALAGLQFFIGLVIEAVFVILYATQLKYMRS